MEGYIDSSIEFYKNEKTATVTFSQGRLINRIRKLQRERPADVEIVTDSDGILCAHIPVKWLRIQPGIELTEEQRKIKADKAHLYFGHTKTHE